MNAERKRRSPVRGVVASLLIFVSALVLVSCEPGDSAGERRDESVRIAAMGLGSSWYVFGATLSQLMGEEFPDERFEVMPKGGGIGNPSVVEAGVAKVGLANVCTSVWARDGDDVYDGKRHENIRALVGALNPVWITAMAREEFIQRTGKSTLEEILSGSDPVRVIMKPRGSSVPVIADMIFEALGTSRKQIEEKGGSIVQVSPKQFASILRDGNADLYIETVTVGHPAVTEVCLTVDMRFLDLPEKVRQPLALKGLAPEDIPQSFKGQTGPTKGVNLGTVLIANQSLSDDLAYGIAKTICEQKETMANAHKAWTRFDPSRAGLPVSTGIALHPGAERYYRERGWIEE